jgi:hypothetical protein
MRVCEGKLGVEDKGALERGGVGKSRKPIGEGFDLWVYRGRSALSQKARADYTSFNFRDMGRSDKIECQSPRQNQSIRQ